MWYEIHRSLRFTVLSIAICVMAYTSLVLGAACIIAPETRQGSLIHDKAGMVRGSRLLAQAFSRPEYLWPRPSAVDYNASGAGGSNLSPTNTKIRARAESILASDSIPASTVVPAELVTASGSGLDPHVTLAAALVQADRIATARQIEVTEIQKLMQQCAESHSAGKFQQQGLVNVLEFNLLLDAAATLSQMP